MMNAKKLILAVLNAVLFISMLEALKVEKKYLSAAKKDTFEVTEVEMNGAKVFFLKNEAGVDLETQITPDTEDYTAVIKDNKCLILRDKKPSDCYASTKPDLATVSNSTKETCGSAEIIEVSPSSCKDKKRTKKSCKWYFFYYIALCPPPFENVRCVYITYIFCL